MKTKRKTISKFIRYIGNIIVVLFITIAALLCFSAKWMFDTWEILTLDEVIFHLTAPIEGTNQDIIIEYMKLCLLPAILVMFLVILLFVIFRNRKKYYIIMRAGFLISLIAAGVTLYTLWVRLDIGEYISTRYTYGDFVENNYVNPSETTIAFPEQKRNLIYIFLESMETIYADEKSGGAFDQNIIPELTEIAQEHEDFSGSSDQLNGALSMTGANWTMGAMFAQTSGLPLNISIGENNMDTQDVFFPGITTLGDILQNAGYSQTLMIGSDAVFGGRKLYYTEHGNYDIMDYNYAAKNGMIDYKVWWGFEDKKLFGFAKEKLTELSAQDAPFNLTMLTVDTHSEEGWVCDACPDIYDSQYSNVAACSSRQVKEFIDWIKEQNFYENTTIVLVGDHLNPSPVYYEQMLSAYPEYERKVYVSFINSAKEPQTSQKRIYNTMDLFPTTLGALGVDIEGNRLGLGTDLFSDTPTLLEDIGYTKLDNGLKEKSRYLEEIAHIDNNTLELQRRAGHMPSAAVWSDGYHKDLEILTFFASNLLNFPENAVSVSAKICPQENRDNAKWFKMEKGTDESGDFYYGSVNIKEFDYQTGEYLIQVYVEDDSGQQDQLGEVVEVVH